MNKQQKDILKYLNEIFDDYRNIEQIAHKFGIEKSKSEWEYKELKG